MKKVLLSVALLTMSAGAFAQFAPELTKNRSAATAQSYVLKGPQQKIIFTDEMPNIDDISKYGEEVQVLSENFSLVTSGSETNPDVDTHMWLSWDEQHYVYLNMKEGYTHEGQWGCQSIYPAGGMVMFNADEDNGGRINTPMLDLSANNGIAILRFRARSVDGTLANVQVVGAETNNMAPSWRYLQMYNNVKVNEEWQDYEFIFTNCGATTILGISYDNQDNVKMLLDDISVSQINAYVNIPASLQHTDYTGTSFKANWEPVADADHYLLDVDVYPNEGMMDTETFKHDIIVNGTSHVVDGIESGATYAYTVRAVKGDKVSLPSNKVYVFDLEAPVLADVAQPEARDYTASWNDVPTAEVFNYWAFNERTAEADGEFFVTDENFDEVKLPNGDPTTEDINNPSYEVYPDTYIKGINQAGWHGENYMPYKGGFVAVDAYHYLYSGENSAIISPELDMSKDGGNITVSARLMGEKATFWDANDNVHTGPTQAAFALFNYDEATGEFKQVELRYADNTSSYEKETVTGAWKNYTVTFTKGSKRSKIGIFGVAYPGNLYIDDVKISQNYAQGESLVEPFYFKRYYDGISLDVCLPVRVNGNTISHKVSAIKASSLTGEIKESAFSGVKTIGVANGIKGISLVEPRLRVNGNVLTVSNPNCEAVKVYTVDGKYVGGDSTGKLTVTVALQAKGAYIVKIGNSSTKVVY